MPRYITGDYNYGQIIPSVSQITARISTLHNGLCPLTTKIIADSYGLQISEIEPVLIHAQRKGLLRLHHMYGWITLQR